jgi:hypothetical protein
LIESERETIYSASLEEMLYNPYVIDLLKKIPATIKASREADKDFIFKNTITKEELKEAYSLPVEDLYHNPKHSELLDKFLGIIRDEPKVEASATTTSPDPKIGLEITEETFSHPVEDLAGADPSCEEVLKGVWKVFKKLEGCHSGELKVSGKSIISL